MLIADAGFVGYAILGTLRAAGQHAVMRVGCNVRLLRKIGFALREQADTVYLWPQGRRRTEAPLVLRLVRAQAGRRTMTLLTSVLDRRLLRDSDVVELYRRRWGIELLYRSLKQTLRRRKMLSGVPRYAELGP